MLKTTKQKGKENIRKSRKRGAREQGITLVALVITIVILIILATVAINFAFGNNGLINRAEQAKDFYANDTQYTEESVTNVESYLDDIIAGAGVSGGDEEETPQEDTTPPTVEIIVGERTENSIAITVNATDDSGEIATYKYYLNGEEKDTLSTNTYTFTGLTAGTEYTIKVEAYDKVNNKGENSTKASTTKHIATNVEELKVGDYVTYPSSQGDLECVVLYDNSSRYGIQIITMDTVEDVTLGSSDFTTSMNSYNSAISTLNSKAEEYNNSTYSSDARSVGSLPDDKNSEAGMYTRTDSWFSTYNGKFKDSDNNYLHDFAAMKSINGGIHFIEKDYWLASLAVLSLSISSDFYVSRVSSESDALLCSVASFGSTYAYSYSSGLRPVFTLKSGIKVTGGDGTSAGTAYTLGV